MYTRQQVQHTALRNSTWRNVSANKFGFSEMSHGSEINGKAHSELRPMFTTTIITITYLT